MNEIQNSAVIIVANWFEQLAPKEFYEHIGFSKPRTTDTNNWIVDRVSHSPDILEVQLVHSDGHEIVLKVDAPINGSTLSGLPHYVEGVIKKTTSNYASAEYVSVNGVRMLNSLPERRCVMYDVTLLSHLVEEWQSKQEVEEQTTIERESDKDWSTW